MKVCKKCLIEKKIEEFYSDKRHKCGVVGICKDCYNLNQKKWKRNNPDKVRNSVMNWHYNNPDRVKTNRINWVKNNPDKAKEVQKNQKQKPEYKIRNSVRKRMNNYLKLKNFTKKNKTSDVFGLTPQELIVYIESQFKDKMSWSNYGYYGWHIDHIIPLSSAKSEDEIYKLCHYTNLQPLWAEDNFKKSNKILKEI